MPDKDSTAETPKRNVPLWVKIFVPLHIIAITSWSLPNAPDQYRGNPPRVPLQIKTNSPVALATSSAEYARNKLLLLNEAYVKNSPLKFYLMTTGFWQYWDMFSPNPANVDEYCDAIVYYSDGSQRKYNYPRMYNLPIPEKFMRERWRKFYERAGDANFRYLWPVFAQHVALMNFSDPKNPPVKVELHKHEMAIAAPGEPVNQTYTDEVYFIYGVKQDELRKDKGL